MALFIDKCLFIASAVLLLSIITTTAAKFALNAPLNQCTTHHFNLTDCRAKSEQVQQTTAENFCKCQKSTIKSYELLSFDCVHSWASPAFLHADPEVAENATLRYATSHLAQLCYASFSGVHLGRLELPYARNLRKVDHGAFKDSRINTVVINLSDRWVLEKTIFEPGVFTYLEPSSGTRNDIECAARNTAFSAAAANSKKGPEQSTAIDKVTGACFGVEIVAQISDKRYENTSKATLGNGIFEGLELLHRLIIEGNIDFFKSDTFQHLYSLRFLRLTGLTLARMEDPKFLENLKNLESLELERNRYFGVNPRLLRKWLADKPKLAQIRLEGGFEIWDSTLRDIENLSGVIELSLNGAKLPTDGKHVKIPKPVFAMEKLRYLDLAGTGIIEAASDFAFENITKIVLSRPTPDYKRHCDCDIHGWILKWDPYKRHGAGVFAEEMAPQNPKTSSAKNTARHRELRVKMPTGYKPLSVCLEKCDNASSGIKINTWTIIMAVLVLTAYI